MKKIYFMLLAVLLSFGGYAQNVTVTATAGTPGPTGYATVKAAFDAINLGTHQGDIIINVNANTTEAAQAVLNRTGTGSTVYTSVLLRPSVDGVTVTGSITSAVIKLNTATNVTIDGDNPNTAGTNRNLSITNTSTTTPGIVWIGGNAAASANNIVLKNCILTNGANTSSGVVTSLATTLGTAGYFTNVTIQNNSISNSFIANYNIAAVVGGNGSGLLITGNDLNTSGATSNRLVGIYVQGVDGATVSNNNIGNMANTLDANNLTGIWFATSTVNSTISGNTISNISGTAGAPRGIAVSSGAAAANINVTGNTISGLTSSSTGQTMGIYYFSTTGGVTIRNNKISNIKNTNAAGWGCNGMQLASTLTTNNANVYNNFISDVASVGFNGVTVDDNGYGMIITAGGGYNIHYNTIVMNTNQTTTTGLPAALNVTSAITTAGTLNIRDNIFVNTQTVGTNRYCVYSGATSAVYSAINYNDYYFTGPNLGNIGGTDRATLAAWRTGTTQDLQSINVQPFFVSATDLHLLASSNCGINGMGTPITTPAITTDIDGDTRNATTPDIGADEFNNATASISYAGSPYCNSGTATVTQTGSTGGSYSSTAGLNINASTGDINLSTSTPGTYTVTYTVAAIGTCPLFTATTSVTINSCADLSITKTDGSTTYIAGSSITYTIVASNAGNSTATGTTVSDVFPAGISGVNWTAVYAGGATGPASGSGNISATVNLPSGGSVTITATGTVGAGVTGSLSNTATVSGPGGIIDPNPGNNSATDTDTQALVDLGISKTDGVTVYTPGATTTYTIVVTNAGPQPANGANIIDAFPSQVSSINWTVVYAGGATGPASGTGNINFLANIPMGGTVTITAVCNLSPTGLGTMTNTAIVTAPSGVSDTNPANNSASDTDTQAALSADLSITKTDGVTTYTAGGTLTYTIVASNAGPNTATGTTVSDVFPAGITGVNWTAVYAGGATGPASGSGNINATVDIPVGGSVTITATGTVAVGTTGSLSNTAIVNPAGSVNDPNPGNNSATDTDTQASADLSITKTDGVTTYIAGGTLTYTIVASNPAGPQAVTGATVTDNFPAGIAAVNWTAAYAGGASGPASGSGNINATVNIPVGGSVTFTAVCTVSGAASGSLSNTAIVAPPTGVNDPTPGNNTATDTDTQASADLSITKTDGVTTYTAGSPITYTIVASNPAGPQAVTGATVTDIFPAAITGVNWTAVYAGGATGPASGTGNINATVNIPVGGSVTFTATGTVAVGTTGLLSNTATVAPPTGVTDPNPANNAATDTDAAPGCVTPPSATISYSGSPYCQNAGTANVTQTGTAGGTYSSTAGLTINASTGAITLGTSTAGTYTVTYFIAASGPCPSFTTTASVTITATPSATISYAGTPYCSNAGTATVTQTGTAGGTYSSTAGLTLNASTGAVTLGTSTAGTYTVTYTVAAGGGCAAFTTTTTITITAAPSATISYAGTPYCSNAGTATVTQTGTAGGTYSSTAGLTISASTGAITLGTSTAGTYTVTYTVAAAGGCAVYTTTTSVTITAAPNATISYTGSPYCQNAGTANVTRTGTAGGTYSSTAGLTLNAATGAVTLGTSTPGTYTVTYTVAAGGGCAAFTTTTTITITAPPTATIAYSGSPYCSNAGTATVTQTGTAGGTYSSTAGLTINASTGAITLGTSTAGTYTVTYTVAAAGGCAAFTTTASVTITAAPNATIAYTGSPYCQTGGTATVTRTGTAGGTYSSTAGLTLNAATGDVTLATSTAGTYTVTYTVAAGGGCAAFTTTTTITITAAAVAPTGATASSPTLCGPGTVTLTAVGGTAPAGATYKWYTGSCGGTLVGTGQVLSNVFVFSTTTFFVRIESACNNTTCASVTVTVAPQPAVVITAVQNVNNNLPPQTIYATVSPVGTYTYQWKRDGVILPNTGDTLRIGAFPSASYSVTVTAVPSGCTATSNTIIIFDNPSVVLYVTPNPNNGHFKVAYYAKPSEMGSTRKLMIYDGKSAKIYDKQYTVTLPYNIIDVDLTTMEARGIYFIALTDGSGKIIASNKVMISK